jgi:hypothetical protein
MSSHPAGEQFQLLLRDFAQAQGLQTSEEAWGLEFEADGSTVLVMSHPRQDEYLMVEVQVSDLSERAEPLSAATLMMLHQINDAARLEHGWFITISAEQTLQIQYSQPVAQTDASQLEALLAEGIDRAHALLSLIDLPVGETAASAPVQGDGHHFIRG